MKKIKLTLFTIFFVMLTNCSGFQKAMRGESKTEETDEFLVKKKDPLIMPPQFEELPIPNKQETKEENIDSVKSVFKSANESANKEKITSDLEKMRLKELNKRN